MLCKRKLDETAPRKNEGFPSFSFFYDDVPDDFNIGNDVDLSF